MSNLFAELLEKESPPPAVTRSSHSPSEESSGKSFTPSRVAAPEQTSTNTSPARKERVSFTGSRVQPSNQGSTDATNVAILQLSRAEVDELRTTAYKNQTFRFSGDELNWLRDRSYGLSRALGRKVGQNDLLRLSLRVFRKLVADKQELLEEILDSIT